MATIIDQQTTLDESLIPSTQRLRIGRSNFRLPSDIQIKEATLQVVYDVLRNSLLFRAFQVVSRHQTTQQYGVILPIELTTEEIRNNKAYKEYYTCAMGEATPKPKASAKKKKGDSASSTTPPTPTPTTTQRGSGTDEGTGSKPGVPNVPSDDSEEELSWNSSDDEDVGSHEEGNKSDESDDDRDAGSDDDSDETIKAGAGKDDDDDDEDDDDKNEEEELAKDDEKDKETGKGGNEVRESEGESDEEETRLEEEESFDPIPRTPKDSEEGSNEEEDQDLRLNTHVTLTPVNPDGPQESSSMSSFVSSMLNPISDVGVESIFTTTSSPTISLQSQTPIMTPSTIATITTLGEALVPPPTIPSIILENLPTFNSAFCFEEIEYMTQLMTEAVREAVQIQTDRLQDSLQRENDEFLHNINENIKKILKGLVKNQVKEQVSCILPRIEESVNATLEAEVLTRSSYSSRTLYAIAADLSDMELKKILIEKMEGNKSIHEEERMMIRKDPPLDQTGGLKNKKKEVSKHQQALHLKKLPGVKAELPKGLNLNKCLPVNLLLQRNLCKLPSRRPPSSNRTWNTTLPAAQGDAQSWISDLAKQTDARSSFNELFDTHIDFSTFIINRLNVDTLTPDLLAGPTYELMRGSCTSLTELEYHLEEAADYGHIKWIEDLVTREMWIQQPIDYNKHVLWGISHWGWKRKQFYRYAVNRESA
nr:hypothetical protein [Tanacetum cinerariifolium]